MKQSEIEVKVLKHDRQIAAIQKLLATGMKILVRLEQKTAQNDRQIAELTKNVNAFVKSMERGRNGRNPSGPKVH